MCIAAARSAKSYQRHKMQYKMQVQRTNLLSRQGYSSHRGKRSIVVVVASGATAEGTHRARMVRTSRQRTAHLFGVYSRKPARTPAAPAATTTIIWMVVIRGEVALPPVAGVHRRLWRVHMGRRTTFNIQYEKEVKLWRTEKRTETSR